MHLKSYCILMSSDKKHLLDRIKAYKVGAQEFLQKPFDLKEAELIVRSKYDFYLQSKGETENDLFTVGKFTVNMRNQQIILNEKNMELTQLEFNLLKFFLMNPEKKLDLNDIVREIWGEFTEKSFESARALIFRLRSKVEPDTKNPIYITNKKNVGYIFYPSGNTII
ncbi:MAG: winged helix-turn-helix domain-containing protein [Candidatus Sericytochromatia bacterium]